MTLKQLLKKLEDAKTQQPYTGEWSSVLYGRDLDNALDLLREITDETINT